MNIKKLATLTVVVFIAFFITDFIIHGMILKSTYHATQHLWRPEAQMSKFMPYMLLGQFTVSLFFSWIFLHGYKGKGPVEGVRYGLLLAGFLAGHNLILFAVVPYTFKLVMAWIGLGAIQAVIAGTLCAVISGKAKMK